MPSKHFIAIDGPPIILDQDHTTFDGEHVVIQAASYGRILFTEAIGIWVRGSYVTISNCLIECQ